MQINKEWLNSELGMLRVDASGSMADKVTLFHERIEKIFAFKLFHSKWTLTEFLILAIAFRIIEELRKPGVYWCELRDWAPITLLFHNDIIAITKRFHHYYYEKLIFLTMLHQSKGISNHAPAIDWLELVESAKADLYINKEMICYKIVDENVPHIIEDIIPGGMLNLVSSQAAKLIRYSTFELSEREECASNEYFPIVYTQQKLAERWQTSEKNIIAACLRSSAFGAYLCIDDNMQICEGTIPSIHAATINQQLLSGKLDTDYKYPLKGYVRLAKKHDLPCGITLSHFYTKKMIEQTDVNSIYIEVPLCKYVLGIYQYIKISQDLEPTLFFNAEEIHKFEQSSSFINLFPQMVFSGLETAIATRDEEKIVFHKKGDCYEIIFDEKSIPPIKTSKGLVYIEHLLKRPNFDIHVMELERLINKSMPQSPDISVSEVEDMGLQISESFTKADMADKKTIKAVRAQIAYINESLEIANENGDIEQAEQLIEEKTRYEDYLSGVTGLHSKPRKIPDEKEKARKRVWYAITNAIKKTHQYHPGLSDYLTNSVRLGEFCTYKPFIQSDF